MAFKKSGGNTLDNNLFVETDRTQIEEYNKETLRRAYNKSLDEIRCIFKKSRQINSHALIADFCDIHVGGGGCELKRFNMALNLVAKCFNSHIIIGGDCVDNGNKNSQTNMFGNRIRPGDSPIVLTNLLNNPKILKKLVAILMGNHDSNVGNRNAATDTSLSKQLAASLGVDAIPYAFIYSVPILTPDTVEKRYQNYFFIHDAGNLDSARKMTEFLMKEFGMKIDGIFIEHFHNQQSDIHSVHVPVYDDNGMRLGDSLHEVFVAMGASFQNGNTIYGAQKMFNNTTNAIVYDASWEINPHYTKETKLYEPKYKAKFVAIRVLDSKKDECGIVMDRYLNYYDIAKDEKYVKELNNIKTKFEVKSFAEIAKELEDFDSSITDEMSKYIKKCSNLKYERKTPRHQKKDKQTRTKVFQIPDENSNSNFNTKRQPKNKLEEDTKDNENTK